MEQVWRFVRRADCDSGISERFTFALPIVRKGVLIFRRFQFPAQLTDPHTSPQPNLGKLALTVCVISDEQRGGILQ